MAPTHKITQSFGYVVLQDDVTDLTHYIFTGSLP